MGFVDAAAAAVAELLDCQGCKRFAEGYCGAVQPDLIGEAVGGGSVILAGAAAAAVVVIVEHVLVTEFEALSAAADFECVAVPVLVAGIAVVAAAAIVGPAQV